MSMLQYVHRKNTDCIKWDNLEAMYGTDNLLALWVADMDFKVPECVTDALQKYVEQGVVGYYLIPEEYYQAFINWEMEYLGYEVEKDWIRYSPGVVSGFNWAINMLTEPGEGVEILAPVYYPFFNAIENNGRRLVTSELVNNDGIYTIDYEDFEARMVSENVKVVIMSSPHNPVGRVWKRDELKKVLDICKSHNVIVLADEIHQDFIHADNEQIPMLAAGEPGEYDSNVIMMTAPSKTFNLAGGQNSIIVIPDDELRAKWDAFTLGLSVTRGNPFGYIAARAAYEEGREWFEELRDTVYGNYLMLKERLEEALPEIRISPLEGTYLMWIDLEAYVNGDEIEELIRDKCRLAVDFGSWFRGENSDTFIRINLATKYENIEEAGKRIVEALK